MERYKEIRTQLKVLYEQAYELEKEAMEIKFFMEDDFLKTSNDHHTLMFFDQVQLIK